MGHILTQTLLLLWLYIFFEFRQGFDFIEILMSGGLEDLRIKLITEGHKIS